MRVRERLLSRREVEQGIEHRHGERAINRGRAQWRIVGKTDRGRNFVVIYDHPHGADGGAARIVSAWPL
jgi:hypothetical protein